MASIRLVSGAALCHVRLGGNMEQEGPSAGRRPLKSRTTRWAGLLTRAALASGISANGMSVLGVLVSILGAAALLFAQERLWLFALAALSIQLRLLANMLDGLIAVEGRRGSATGAIFNEFPDRIEDSLFLVAAGYACGFSWLGWLAALLAAICAYVRLLGATLGFPQDFGGPMAKPQRMAALTLGCLVAIVWAPALQAALALIAAGTALTIVLRLARLSRAMKR
jgi:phosphatidylglycerophosphate synthase